MSKTVTVRRGEKLPENMVAPWVATTVLEPRSTNLKPGDVLPSSSVCDSITVEVRDDPPQAYLVVPCEKGKGTHVKDRKGEFCCCQYGTENKDHKQIPFPLTLEDLQQIRGHLAGTGPKISPVTFELFERLSDTIAAWSAVPPPKEANK